MLDRADVTVSIAKGDFRTFGPFGPAYQVLSVDNAKETVHVRVLKTGEELDYSIRRAARDPEPA